MIEQWMVEVARRIVVLIVLAVLSGLALAAMPGPGSSCRLSW